MVPWDVPPIPAITKTALNLRTAATGGVIVTMPVGAQVGVHGLRAERDAEGRAFVPVTWQDKEALRQGWAWVEGLTI